MKNESRIQFLLGNIEAIKKKLEEVNEVAMKVGQSMYQAQQAAGETNGASETSETSKTSETGETSETSKENNTESDNPSGADSANSEPDANTQDADFEEKK